MTARQWEILLLLADGQDTETIATQLGVSSRTVKYDLADINRELQTRNRTQAVAVAIRNGWI